jgi:hypothetical protein
VALRRSYLSFSVMNHFSPLASWEEACHEPKHNQRDYCARPGHEKIMWRWVPHELTLANKWKRLGDARTLPHALRSDSEKHFTHIIWPATWVGSTIIMNRRQCLDTSEIMWSQEFHRR